MSRFIVCHTCFATCFFSDSVCVVACCCVRDIFESHSTVCCVCRCSDYFVTFFKFKLIFTCFKSFTFQDFSSRDSSTCCSRFISVGEGWVVTCNSRLKLALTVICNFYLNFVFSSIVCHTFFATCFFSDSVSVVTCCCELNFFESNSSVCSVFSCRNDFVTFFFFKFKLVFISFKLFTVQDFSSCDDNRFCWFSFINVRESNVLCIWCCNKLTLTVIFNDYFYFISIWIVFNSGYITCFFRDSECTGFFLCELKFWELNLTVCIV